MAAVSAVQYGKQKKSVYGKAGKSNWSSNTTFFDDSDDELAGPTTTATSTTNRQRITKVDAPYRIQKSEVRKAAERSKPAKRQSVERDLFDVPSGDDEPSPPLKVIRRPVLKTRQALVNDHVSEDAQAAPWERRHACGVANNHVASSANITEAVGSPGAQLHHDLTEATGGNGNKSSPKQESQTVDTLRSPAHSTPSKTQPAPISAAARLAERRKAQNVGVQSSNVQQNHNLATNPKRAPDGNISERGERKRARTAVEARQRSVDVVMVAPLPTPVCETNPEEDHSMNEDPSVYDIPDSGVTEHAKPMQHVASPKVVSKQTRRGKLAPVSSKPSPQKGLSAPARLMGMLPVDSDTTEASSPSSDRSISRAGTPQKPLSSPCGSSNSPEAAMQPSSQLTPKQAQLWSSLLPTQPVAPSPSALAMRDLTITGRQRRKQTTGQTRKLAKSQSDIPRRGARLVDRLKAAAPETSDVDTSDESGEDEDVVMAEERPATARPALLRADSSVSSVTSSRGQHSQNRSQSRTTSNGGPKRTYAAQRSHLVDDSFEGGLMEDLIDAAPVVPRGRKTLIRSQSNSQKTSFDIDSEGDEDSGGGQIRTIHELRASGRKIRGTEDVEQLLDDIVDRGPSHRSSRRSALIQLATKLADKTFTAHFVDQGCELRLARECMSCKDDIASYSFAGAIAFLLVSEPPAHTVRTLQDHGIVSWLVDQLQANRDLGKMAKDRQHNMAKASQKSLAQLGEVVESQQSLWGDEKPSTMSLRLVALKALDLLVGKLRRSGNKNELLTGQQLHSVLPNIAVFASEGQHLEASIIISILESLSTTSLALEWDAATLGKIAQILPSLDLTSPLRRHTLFLTLRLSLNLTTDNPKHCSLLATADSTRFLLQAVLDGFATIVVEQDEEKRTIALDLLVLALGITINLFEHSAEARTHAVGLSTPNLVSSLVETFKQGQKRMLDAESVEESVSNVAFGYLAVMLANLCQNADARILIAGLLQGQGLSMLVDAVEEFVLYHQQVDKLNFSGEEGQEVWGAFTEKLQRVLDRLVGLDGEGGA